MRPPGLGVMGYPMAINLRRKIAHSSPLVISELNKTVVLRFVEETKGLGEVIVGKTAREVAEKSVSTASSPLAANRLDRR